MANTVAFSPYGGDTIKALQARQAALQQNAPELPSGTTDMRSPWQGASYLANTLVNNLQQNAAAGQERTARKDIATFIAQHAAGQPWTSDQIAAIYARDPELGLHIMDTETAKQLAADKLAAEGGNGPKRTDINSLADDYNNEADVQSFDNAQSMWRSMQDAATRDTPQADQNMVIALAKLYDPGSVVRSEEGKAVELTGNAPNSVKAAFMYLLGTPGARLGRSVRQGMMQEAYSRMNGYYAGVEETSKWYSERAKRGGYDPNDIVRPRVRPVEFDLEKVVGSDAVEEPPAEEDNTVPDDGSEPVPTPENTDDFKIGTKYVLPGGGVGVYIGGDPNKKSSWKKIRVVTAPAGG